MVNTPEQKLYKVRFRWRMEVAGARIRTKATGQTTVYADTPRWAVVNAVPIVAARRGIPQEWLITAAKIGDVRVYEWLPDTEQWQLLPKGVHFSG